MTALAEEVRIFPGSWEISDRVQQGLTVSWIALALNMNGETVKGWLASGALPSWRVIEGCGWRYVRLADLAQVAEQRGLPVNWAALM